MIDPVVQCLPTPKVKALGLGWQRTWRAKNSFADWRVALRTSIHSCQSFIWEWLDMYNCHLQYDYSMDIPKYIILIYPNCVWTAKNWEFPKLGWSNDVCLAAGRAVAFFWGPSQVGGCHLCQSCHRSRSHFLWESLNHQSLWLVMCSVMYTLW